MGVEQRCITYLSAGTANVSKYLGVTDRQLITAFRNKERWEHGNRVTRETNCKMGEKYSH